MSYTICQIIEKIIFNIKVNFLMQKNENYLFYKIIFFKCFFAEFFRVFKILKYISQKFYQFNCISTENFRKNSIYSINITITF